jgi:zinc transporter ZupT
MVALAADNDKAKKVARLALQFDSRKFETCTNTVSTADAHAGHSHRRGGRRSAGHSANAFPVVLDFPAGTYPQTWFFFSDADLVGDFEMVVKKEGTTTAIASSSKEVHADPNKCSAAATTTASCDCDDDKYMWAGLILAIGLVGMFPIFFKQCATSAMAMYILGLFNCFGGGALLGVAVGHVFPEAIDLYPPSKSDDYPAAAMLVATGYIALLVCDKLFLALCGPEDECQEEPAAPPLEKSGKDADETTVGVAPASSAPMVDLSSESAPASAQGSGSGCNGLDDPNATAVPATLTQAIGVFIGMALHSVMAGLTLGLKTDKTSMENLGIAIVCHKLFDVTALAIVLVRTDVGMLKSIPYCLIVALMTPIGCIAGINGGDVSNNTNGALQALATGTFLYVAIQEVLAHEFAKKAPAKDVVVKVIACVLGVGMIGLASISHTRGGHTH